MMDVYISNFPQQLKDALSVSQNFSFSLKEKIQNVIITGMGGSGIAGTFVQEFSCDYLDIPILVNKSYHLPSFVNENTLLIASSYSGNTEETLSCVKDGINKKAQIIAITSGGELEKICHQHKYPVMFIPAGFPPRTALGYSLIQQLNILSLLHLIPETWKQEMIEISEFLLHEQVNIRNIAKEIARQTHRTFPIIYSLHSEALALRLRQQLNENSKILCSHHIIPEMNHNELVGWRNLYAHHSVISILTDFDLPQNRKRYLFCKEVFSEFKVPVIELIGKGKTMLAQWMYIVHLSDWISYELALLNKVDAVEVRVIEKLKQRLKD